MGRALNGHAIRKAQKFPKDVNINIAEWYHLGFTFTTLESELPETRFYI